MHKMGSAAHKAEGQGSQMGMEGLTSSQTAEYTQDMLDSLKKIAVQQRQAMLVRLLEAASIEAGRIAGRRNHATG
jgi:hypothetical protein